jgi:hypothetical protein
MEKLIKELEGEIIELQRDHDRVSKYSGGYPTDGEIDRICELSKQIQEKRKIIERIKMNDKINAGLKDIEEGRTIRDVISLVKHLGMVEYDEAGEPFIYINDLEDIIKKHNELLLFLVGVNKSV